MTPRIALAAFRQATNTFAAGPTGLAELVGNLRRGAAVRALRGTNTVLGGALAELNRDPSAATSVPLVAAEAIAGGPLTTEAFDTVAGAITTGLTETAPDALLLDLQGAMVTEQGQGGEATLLRAIRRVVGPNLPIAVVVDATANLDPALVDLANALLVADSTLPATFPGSPHLRGADAVHLLERTVDRTIRPVVAIHKAPLLLGTLRWRADVEPARSLLAHVTALEHRPGVLAAGLAAGFVHADVSHAGSGAAITTDDDAPSAQALAAELTDRLWERHRGFDELGAMTLTVEEAIHAAMDAETGTRHGPFVLADLGDDPGSGGAGDGTALLWGLLDLGAPGAALAPIADPDAVARTAEAGIDGRLELALGAKTDEEHGYPIDVRATVRALLDGRFTRDGPIAAGRQDDLGRVAVLVCDGRYGNTVEVVVSERRAEVDDPALFRALGIEPTRRRILAVKTGRPWPAFASFAARVLAVDTPGRSSPHLSRFPFRQVPRPIWPLDEP